MITCIKASRQTSRPRGGFLRGRERRYRAGPQAVPQADRPYLPSTPRAHRRRTARKQKQTADDAATKRKLGTRGDGLIRQDEETARTSKRKARPVCRLEIHGTASSSACKASKVAAARRVLVARAYRYIQRRQLFSERQESNQDCRQFMTDKTDDSSRWYML